MTIDLLRESYRNVIAKNGLIAFTKEVRGPKNDCSGKYSVSLRRLDSLFASKVWKPIKKPDGHRKFQHQITQTVIEYQNHDSRGGVDPGAVTTILESVQKTINKLGNDIFKYDQRNWKKEPDYPAALKRLGKN